MRSRSELPARVCLAAASIVAAAGLVRADGPVGHRPEAAVREPTRIDWVFALSNQSPASPPADWLADYDSSRQTFELYVPPSAKSAGTPAEKPSKKPQAGGSKAGKSKAGKTQPERKAEAAPGLILFLSPGDRGMGLNAVRELCDARNLLFASPHNAGNGVDTRRRVRIVLDVLDQLRRDYGVDPDRTYVGGFSGGGRIACAIAFALPEHFGGALPVCAAGDLREEPWLRHRVRDRLSVAHLTGESDFNRGEVERFRGPMLAAVGVRSRIWVAPRTGHALPPASTFQEAVEWLEEGLPQRRRLAEERPASRIAADDAPSRDESARRLLDEGRSRTAAAASKYSGLMQVKGVLERWPDLPAADEAKKILLEVEQGADRAWEAEDVAEQRRFLVARARSLSDYAIGPLPEPYVRQRPDMAEAAQQLWKLVIEDGQDEAAVAEARRRLPELQKAAEDDSK